MTNISSLDSHNYPDRRPCGVGEDGAGRGALQTSRNTYDIFVITNDIYTKEDQLIITRAQALPAERIMESKPEAVLTPQFVRMLL
jgi:hypothetical protein